MSSKYKAADGRYRTESLFREISQPSSRAKYPPVFSITPEDKDVPSMHRLFVESDDPTEYKFAIEVLGSWHHWCVLKERTWFKPYYEVWRAELDTKLKSRGVEILQAIADSNKPTAANAAKWLAEGGWEQKAKPKRGRPSKEEIAGERKALAKEDAELADDVERLGLKAPTTRAN